MNANVTNYNTDMVVYQYLQIGQKILYYKIKPQKTAMKILKEEIQTLWLGFNKNTSPRIFEIFLKQTEI